MFCFRDPIAFFSAGVDRIGMNEMVEFIV